jgi:hypothetical protein
MASKKSDGTKRKTEDVPSSTADSTSKTQHPRAKRHKVSPIYFGDGLCSYLKANGTACDKKAYYYGAASGRVACGRHAPKSRRRELPKDPNAAAKKQAQYTAHLQTVANAKLANRASHRAGTVVGVKMRMMHNPELVSGYLNVRPNFNDRKVTDALGLPALSPKSMGPIPTVGAANLENLHQGNKVFAYACEGGGDNKVDAQIRDLEQQMKTATATMALVPTDKQREQIWAIWKQIDSALVKQKAPTAAFTNLQSAMLKCKEPYRHQHSFLNDFAITGIAKSSIPNRKSNVPLYSVFQGTRMSYLQSRQVYCQYYEQFAANSPEFKSLKKEVEEGQNVCICGYDAYPVTGSLLAHYFDPDRPFGHELVLIAMLTIASPQHYPWQQFRTIQIT